MSSIIFGLLFLTAGVLLFAFNAGVLPLIYKKVFFSWQMALIALGFAFLFSRDKWIAGVILIFIGGFFILPKLEFIIPFQIGYFVGYNFWAIGLVFVGIVILCSAIWGSSCCRRNPKVYYTDTKRERHCSSHHYNLEEAGYIDRNNVFGGSKEKIDYTNFKGGEINSVFGGIELDFSGSKLAEGVHRLELNSVFGGIVLFVPVDWNIEMQTTHVFGNFVDNRPKPAFEVDEKRTLIIEANAVFGGGEIRCRE